MAVTAREAREQILGELGHATEQLGHGVACLGDAYEQLDPQTAERLEDGLFRPVQKAFGRAKRTRQAFAERFGLTMPSPQPPTASPEPRGVKALVERAVADATGADHRIAELQDSMLPIEAGDAELRDGLAEVRELLSGLPSRAREITRRLGR